MPSLPLGRPATADWVEGRQNGSAQSRFAAGEVIYRQDDEGDCCYFLVAGECFATKQLHTLEPGSRVEHKKRGMGTVTEVEHDPHRPSITTVLQVTSHKVQGTSYKEQVTRYKLQGTSYELRPSITTVFDAERDGRS